LRKDALLIEKLKKYKKILQKAQMGNSAIISRRINPG
jgi:hypothetical protein